MNCSSDTRRQYLRNLLRREPTAHEQMMLVRVGDIHPLWIRTVVSPDCVSPGRREARSLVRIALADAFPGIRFGITLGDRPVVTWTGGPFEHEVFTILNDFEENMITSSYVWNSRLFLTPSGRVVKQPEPLSVGLTIGRWRHNFRDELTRFPTAAEARIMRRWLAGCPSVPDDFVSRIRFGRRRASFGHMPAPQPGYPDRDSVEGSMLEKCLGLLVLAGHRPGPRLWLAEPSG